MCSLRAGDCSRSAGQRGFGVRRAQRRRVQGTRRGKPAAPSFNMHPASHSPVPFQDVFEHLELALARLTVVCNVRPPVCAHHALCSLTAQRCEFAGRTSRPQRRCWCRRCVFVSVARWAAQWLTGVGVTAVQIGWGLRLRPRSHPRSPSLTSMASAPSWLQTYWLGVIVNRCAGCGRTATLCTSSSGCAPFRTSATRSRKRSVAACGVAVFCGAYSCVRVLFAGCDADGASSGQDPAPVRPRPQVLARSCTALSASHGMSFVCAARSSIRCRRRSSTSL